MSQAVKWARSAGVMVDAGGPSSTPAYRELLEQARNGLAEELVAQTVEYLRAGHVVMPAAGVGFDRISEDNISGACGSVVSDGEWCWTDELPHYVTTYRVALPEEFIAHMAQNSWRCPQLPSQVRVVPELLRDATNPDGVRLGDLLEP